MSNRLSRSAHKLLLGAGTIALCLVPTIAQAHPGVDHGSGFGAGFQHPIGGLDHILAMVAVGGWAAQLGGRARWALPLAFMGAMLLGGGMGIVGLPLPGVEFAIVASDLLLAGLVLLALRLPIRFCLALVGGLALFHGYAHGTEMPQMAQAGWYAAGFTIATAGLHGIGLLIATAFSQLNPAPFRWRWLGGGSLLVGSLYVLVNAIGG